MSQFRLARISLLLAAIGLNAVPALLPSAYAQAKPAADAPKGPIVRKELAKVLDSAKTLELIKAKKFDEVQASIAAAEALPDRTPAENYFINRVKASLGQNSGNDALVMSSLEALVASGIADKEENLIFLEGLAEYNYRAKNYPKAVEWFKRYQAASPTPEKVRSDLIRAQYFAGDYASAKAGLDSLVGDTVKAGKKPELNDLLLLASSSDKLGDKAAYAATVEKLVTYHPSDAYWSDMLRRSGAKSTFNERLLLDQLRLQSTALQKLTANEYVTYAELAMRGAFYVEAKKALDAGFAKGVLGSGKDAALHKQLLDKATKGAADDTKNIASGETAANAAKTGQPLVNLGYAYVTMDQFDKGIAMIEKGIAKGGLKNADDARLRLGAAYALAGRKAEAVKVFEGLSANDGLGDLAKHWTMYVNAPVATAAAPAPAAAATK